MRLLIDGYNLLFRVKEKSSTLRAARQELIDDLSALLSSRTFESSVIFDSDDSLAEIFPTRSEHPPIEVIYSPHGKTADCYILELVEIAKRPAEITVVSSDRALTAQAKSMGAQIMTVEAFLKMVERKKATHTEDDTPHISEKELARLEKIFTERLEKLPAPDDKPPF